MKLREKGVKVRFITEITPENIRHGKELAKYLELRHLDEINDNFAIIDRKYYGASTNIYELSPNVEFIHSNVKPFVDQQRAFFDMLWKKKSPQSKDLRKYSKQQKENL